MNSGDDRSTSGNFPYYPDHIPTMLFKWAYFDLRYFHVFTIIA